MSELSQQAEARDMQLAVTKRGRPVDQPERSGKRPNGQGLAKRDNRRGTLSRMDGKDSER